MKRIVIAGLPLLLWLGWSGAAAASSDTDQTASPYFFVEGASSDEAFPLKSTKVTAVISGVIANVTVKQAYENTGTSTFRRMGRAKKMT